MGPARPAASRVGRECVWVYSKRRLTEIWGEEDACQQSAESDGLILRCRRRKRGEWRATRLPPTREQRRRCGMSGRRASS